MTTTLKRTNNMSDTETNMPKITGARRPCADGEHSYYVYDDFKALQAWAPHRYNHPNYYGIAFYEHPVDGGDAPVIAMLDGTAWDCEFYDPWNDCDQGYINMQAVHLGLLPADTIVWPNCTRREIADDLRAPISNLFVTHPTFSDLEEYINKFSDGPEKALALVIMGMTINTTLHVMAKEVEEQGR